MTTDIRVENHGSLFLLRAVSDEGYEWLSTSLAEDAQWFGPRAVAVEPRYVADIVAGARDAGLDVQ